MNAMMWLIVITGIVSVAIALGKVYRHISYKMPLDDTDNIIKERLKEISGY